MPPDCPGRKLAGQSLRRRFQQFGRAEIFVDTHLESWWPVASFQVESGLTGDS